MSHVDDPYKRKQKWCHRGVGPNGRKLCFSGCGKEVGVGRQSSCSEACAYQWRLRNHPQVLAAFMLKRDRGVCARCGVDTEWLRDVANNGSHFERAEAFEIADALGHSHPYKTKDKLNSRYITFYSCYELKDDVKSALEIAEFMHNREIEIPWRAFQEQHRLDCKAKGFNDSGRRWWEADHIVPVIEGGGGCGPEGYRTLCLPCHKTVTAELAARRAERRRKAKQPELSL